MAAVVVILCIVNVALWVIGVSRFNKRFSTESVIRAAREELNNMLLDINRNADRNISLLEDRISQLKAAVAEADSHLEIMKAELQRAGKAQEFQERLEAAAPKKPAAAKKPRGGRSRPLEAYAAEQLQGDLFSLEAGGEEPSPVPLPEKDSRGRGGTAGARVSPISPVIQVEEPEPSPLPPVPRTGEPQVYQAAEQIMPRQDFRKQVRELSALGMTVEEIAVKVARSTQEVEFALEFS